ncbi:hypothetical protein L1049_027396 [Liquidambar formosana]|uniref:Fe2OG dioxygenase domain-containing protein n=1 Tax=Liquidambar formosana TaxID=63359 RepID=A0AAP0WSD4_LIQFO
MEEKTLLREVFGESSDSEDDEQHPQFVDSTIHEVPSESLHQTNPSWERIIEIDGLWSCTDFLSSQQQSSLLSAIEKEGWFTEASHNQAMRFGDLPTWATELSSSIREAVIFGDCVSEPMDLATSNGDKEACLLPSDLLWREPFFDQIIVNVYQPGEGICAHVDLMRFEDGIAIVSLESSCVMHFSRVEAEAGDNGKEGKNNLSTTKIPVYLTSGSLVLMSGEARYHWKHEINRKSGFQMWEGQEINQKRRTSITLRKLCQVE